MTESLINYLWKSSDQKKHHKKKRGKNMKKKSGKSVTESDLETQSDDADLPEETQEAEERISGLETEETAETNVPNDGDFVLVKFSSSGKKGRNFVGKIVTDFQGDSSEFEVDFMRKKAGKKETFGLP